MDENLNKKVTYKVSTTTNSDDRKDGGKEAENKYENEDTATKNGGEGRVVEEDGEDGESEEDDNCPPCPLEVKPEPEEVKNVRWTHPCVKTFPSVKETEVTKKLKPELKALKRLRSRLRPFTGHPCYHSAVSQSDTELLAWLTTFDLNVFKVEAMLKRHCQARLSMGLDSILTDYKPSEVLQYHYTGGLCGVDRQNRPIWYELLGKLDMNSLVKSVTKEDLVRHKFYQLEKIKSEVKKTGTSQILVIVDMKGVSRNALGAALEIWRTYIDIVQDHYPYLVNEYIIIHTPIILTEFTLSLRPYLNSLTRSKVTVLGHKYGKYLQMRIEKHQIPAYLGGYKCDIDNNPWCKENLNWDGVVPRWMHTYSRIAANVHPLTILGGERLVEETHVVTPGSHVYWSFIRLSQPISLAVYRDRISDDCCVVREKRVEPKSLTYHAAGIISEGAGRYLTVMDNCKNFASPVKGLYKIVVQPPVWLEAHLAEKDTLGDSFDTDTFMEDEEKAWHQWKSSQEPHCKWKYDLPPIAKI